MSPTLRMIASSLLVCALSLLGCSHAQKGSVAAPAAAPAASPVSPSVFLWQASSPHKPGTLFLLGSIHLRAAAQAQVDQAVFEALRSCERVAFELDFDAIDLNEVTTFMLREGKLPQGKTLRDVISPETYAKFVAVTNQRGMRRDSYEGMQPWLAAFTLMIEDAVARGFDPDQGVDRKMLALAKNEPSLKRQVIGLETMLEQLELLRDSAGQAQDAMLAETLQSVEDGEVEKMMALYASGDERGLEEFMQETREKDPRLEPYYTALLDVRNRNMAERLAPYLEQPGCTFVTVGAGHVMGDTGLVRLFEAQGLVLRSVPPKGPAADAVQALAVERPKVLESAQDGFHVEMPGMTLTRELPIAGAEETGRMYMSQRGGHGALTITVVPVPHVPEPGARGSMLEEMATQTLAQAGLGLDGKLESITLAGEPAMRGRGTGQGPLLAADIVVLLHGTKSYVFLALAQTPDPEAQRALQKEWHEVLASLRWIDGSTQK